MKTLILTFVLTIFSLILLGQPIETYPGGGARFHRNGQSMTLAQVEQAVQGNAEAAELISKARGGNVGAGVLGFIGGGLIGWPLGTALAGGDPNWALAAIGVGVVVISIPISIKAGKNAREGVAVYNSSLQSSQNNQKWNWEFVSMGTGIGLRARF